MALDGIAVSAIVHELNEKLTGGRVDKIHQPERDEVVLIIRGFGHNYRLMLTANAGSPRACITALNKDNPLKPPLFCMVMRKHLTSGKIISIEQPDFERIIIFNIESANEMGDLCVKKLIIEIMGKHSNIILLGESGEILDSVKHISFETSSVREVLPGKIYIFPPSKGKLNPMDTAENIFMERMDAAKPSKLINFIYQTYNGISPVIASEICFRAGIDADTHCEELSVSQKETIFNEFKNMIAGIYDKSYTYRAYYNDDDKLFDFSCVDMTQFGRYRYKEFGSVSELLEFFYTEKDISYRIGQKSQDLRKLVQLNIERCVKKKDLQQKILMDIEDRDVYRIYGELITANIYAIKKGEKEFTTDNYYDEDMKKITIPLDHNKTANENAQRYFARYNKEKRTFTAMQNQIIQNDEDLNYLEGVMTAIQNSVEESDIEDIRRELADEGFVKKKSIKKGAQRQKTSKPWHYISSDGFSIFVGRNNRQNDELTLKTASGNDIWMHTKDIPGSHIIIKTDGKHPPDSTLNEAAMLCAYYSKARASSLVPVDYTLKKNVKKPSGAKPGMVIYDKSKTAYVTPSEDEIKKIKKALEV